MATGVVVSNPTSLTAVTPGGITGPNDVVVTTAHGSGTLAGGFNVGDLNTDNLLDPGELWVYTATAIAVAGQYENYATVTGTSTIR